MAVYLKKREQRHRDIIDSYYRLLNEAEKYAAKETAAAIIVQKDIRMFRVKWNYEQKKRAT